MKQIKTTTNYNHEEQNYKFFTMPSQTIPDQTLSIREILERHSRGFDLGGTMESLFEDEDNPSSGVHPKMLDLVDLQILKEQTAEKIKTITSDIETQKSKKAADKAAKDAQALKNKIIEEFKQTLPERH